MATVKIQGFAGMRVSGYGIAPVAQGPSLANSKSTITTTGTDQTYTVPAGVTLLRIHVKEAPVLMEIGAATDANSEEYPATAETPWIEYRGVNAGDIIRFKNA